MALNILHIKYQIDGLPVERAQGKVAFENGFQQFASKIAFGISGDQTQHLLYRLDHGEIPKGDVKHVVVHIGVNNLRQGFSAKATYEGIMAVVHKLESFDNVDKIHILPLLPGAPTIAKSVIDINNELQR